MTVPKLIGLLMLLGTANGVVISHDVEKYLKELTDWFFQNESHIQLLDNVIWSPLFSRFLPDVFHGSQWNNYIQSYFFQFRLVHYKSQFGQNCLERTLIRIQGLYMDSKEMFYWYNKLMYATLWSLILTILAPNFNATSYSKKISFTFSI